MDLNNLNYYYSDTVRPVVSYIPPGIYYNLQNVKLFFFFFFFLNMILLMYSYCMVTLHL